jgi:hypothetical protein
MKKMIKRMLMEPAAAARWNLHRGAAGLALAACVGGSTGAAFSAPVSLGKMEPYWRYSAALGPFHEGGQALETIPDYLGEGDFPYRKRPSDMEVPFCDHLSMVRILGGFSNEKDPDVHQRDLAYRDQEGKIRYRMELLEPRLRPYLDAGHTDLTIVLDNVPWCFPEEPKAVGLGQYMPPRDPREWHDFIQEFCHELVSIMGHENANRLRFRVGTENNGLERFGGTHEEFIRHYDASAAAVKSVLPGAQFGAFNLSGANVAAFRRDRYNVNLLDLAGHTVNGTNTFTGGEAAPFDWVAFSRYYRVDTDPEDSARGCREVWEEFEKRFPKLEGVSREIHEFGIAPWGETGKGDAFVSMECGSLGTAVTAQMMLRLREAGIDRLWHWGMTDRFRDRDNKLRSLFTGHAWLLAVFEHTVGREAWLLEPESPSPQGLNALALVAEGPEDVIILVSAYQPREGVVSAPESFSFRLPDSIKGLEELRYVAYDKSTAAHDIIRVELEQDGLLEKRFQENPTRTGGVREMGTGREAEMLVGDQLARFEQLWVDSMTLKPLPEARGQVLSSANGTILQVELTPPEVLVVRAKLSRRQ